MGNQEVVGLSELRPLFGPYEQFVNHLWNVFFQALVIVDLYGTAPSDTAQNTKKYAQRLKISTLAVAQSTLSR